MDQHSHNPLHHSLHSTTNNKARDATSLTSSSTTTTTHNNTSLTRECRFMDTHWGRASHTDDGLTLHRLLAQTHNDDWPPGKSWQAVLTRIHSHPHEVRVLDRRGRTCLMAAYAKASYAPMAVLQALVVATPGVYSRSVRDKTGWTALMIGIDSDAPLECVQLLLMQQPSAMEQVLTCDHQGNLPLHKAVQRSRRDRVVTDDRERRLRLVQCLLEYDVNDNDDSEETANVAARQVAAENNAGKTPIHVALEHRMPYEVLESLVTGTFIVLLYCTICCRNYIITSRYINSQQHKKNSASQHARKH
jgi:hypothetical protein